MTTDSKTTISRRTLIRRAAGGSLLGSAFAFSEAGRAQAAAQGVNKNSAPSDLKITDVRGCTIKGAETFIYPTIRIDTNQGVSGLGEVFVLGNAEQALVFKPMLVGKNPLLLEPILQSLRRFTNQDASGGYSAIDIALHDIAGKVYGVPVWRLLGSKLRDRARLYCDTLGSTDPKVYGAHMLERKNAGYTFFKMDLYTSLVAEKPGAVHTDGAATEKGLGYLGDLIGGVRDAIGWDQPLAADHFGNISVHNAIRYARAFERYQLAWAEDMVPYTDWQGLKAIREATTTPQCTGEYGFGLKEAFRPLLDNHAVDLIHVDVTTCGGLLELHRIADYADMCGIPIVLHACNGPVAQAAAIHAAATMTNFVALEFHAVECDYWSDLAKGPMRPVAERGHMRVSDAPGLGIEMNEEVARGHLTVPARDMAGQVTLGGYFEPTPRFDEPILGGQPGNPSPNSWRQIL
jgi:L-alanine-DL-glutamate epimerase-like enolase superfamily enzyme